MLHVFGYTGYWRVTRLGVRPPYRRQGIAGELLDWAGNHYLTVHHARRVSVTTAMAQVIAHCDHSPLWHRARVYRQGGQPHGRHRSDSYAHATSTGRGVVSYFYFPLDTPQRGGL